MMSWLGYAIADMLLLGLSAVLAKSAIRKNNSNLAAFLWGIFLFIFSIIMIHMTKTGPSVMEISVRSWLFLILSGLVMGASWIFLFKALRTGQACRVVPVYFFHYVLVMLARMLLFRKTYSLNQVLAMILLSVGTLLVALHSGKGKRAGYKWLWHSLLAAFLTCVSVILLDYGVSNVPEYVSLGVRIAAALVLTLIATVATGAKSFRSMTFPDGLALCLSGAAIGARFLCYHRALALGPHTIVQHMDCLSVLAVLLFGCIFLRERISLRAVVGYVLVVCGIFFLLLQTPIMTLLQ